MDKNHSKVDLKKIEASDVRMINDDATINRQNVDSVYSGILPFIQLFSQLVQKPILIGNVKPGSLFSYNQIKESINSQMKDQQYFQIIFGTNLECVYWDDVKEKIPSRDTKGIYCNDFFGVGNAHECIGLLWISSPSSTSTIRKIIKGKVITHSLFESLGNLLTVFYNPCLATNAKEIRVQIVVRTLTEFLLQYDKSLYEEWMGVLNNSEAMNQLLNIAQQSSLVNILKKRLRALRSGIEIDRNSIARQQGELLSAYQMLQNKIEQLNALEQIDWNTKADQEIQEIMKHPITDSVVIEDNAIRIITKNVFITITYESRVRTYDIGVLELSIGFTGQVTIRNLTRMINSKAHPHAYSGGSICFGNMAASIVELISNAEFAVAAHILLEFVQTVNMTDSFGRGILLYPEIDTKSTEEKEN